MCVIAYKPAGVAMPAKDIIANMWTSNDDGAGFMYPVPKKGLVQIEKGFMKKEHFNSAIDFLGKTIDLQALPVVMHFRVATHGSVVPALTHPFPISRSYTDLCNLSIQTSLAVVHNGMISGYGEANYSYYGYGQSLNLKKDKELDESDTMDYIKKQLAPLKELCPSFYLQDAGREMVKTATKNKWAFLDGKGKVSLVGEFIEDGGMFYSNMGFLPLVKKAKSVGTPFVWSSFDDYCGSKK